MKTSDMIKELHDLVGNDGYGVAQAAAFRLESIMKALEAFNAGLPGSVRALNDAIIGDQT